VRRVTILSLKKQMYPASPGRTAPAAAPREPAPAMKRHVLRGVTFDHRGDPIADWVEVDAPADPLFERMPLSIAGEPPSRPSVQRWSESVIERSRSKKKDLRALSEWIKMMRARDEA
jgi:hypothetical protein